MKVMSGLSCISWSLNVVPQQFALLPFKREILSQKPLSLHIVISHPTEQLLMNAAFAIGLWHCIQGMDGCQEGEEQEDDAGALITPPAATQRCHVPLDQFAR